MPEPIDYQIVRNLQTALRAITVAGGYHYDVASLAVKLDPNQDIEQLIGDQALRPFVILEPTPGTWEYQPSKRVKLTIPVTIHWVQESDPTVDESRLLTCCRGVADVEQAIAVDIFRGALAIDTRITRVRFETVPDSAQVWVMVEIEISLIRIYGQPNTL